MRPDPNEYRGDEPDYLRHLIELAGISHREAARICAEKPGDFRRYLNGARSAPYPVQVVLELLAEDGARDRLAGVLAESDAGSTIGARLDTHAPDVLAEFARVVLRAMESTSEWSADMVDDFNTAARTLGLAGHDGGGMFRIIPSRKPGPPATARDRVLADNP